MPAASGRASKSMAMFVTVQILALTSHLLSAMPTPAVPQGKSAYNRALSEERPLQEQIAEVEKAPETADSGANTGEADRNDLYNDDFRLLKTLAEQTRQLHNNTEGTTAANKQDLIHDADSGKNRRTDDYDSTKSNVEKFPDNPESFRQVDGTPLTAEQIVQKIATKIYEEDDRGVFDKIVSKLLKLGLITESQADTLEYEVAEALQDLISKNAKNRELEDVSMDYPIKTNDFQQGDTKAEVLERLNKDTEDEQLDVDSDDTLDNTNTWLSPKEPQRQTDLNSVDGIEDLQYFPSFYKLLQSLNSERDAQERDTLITIMKTLIDFVKMMVKYGTITPEEGVAYLENLDAVIALQMKNKLGKALTKTNSGLAPEKTSVEVDNTKEGSPEIQKESEAVKDSTKDNTAVQGAGLTGKSETYLEAIRKNIEWLKKHRKDDNKEEYNLPKLRDVMEQQVDAYIDKGILQKDEGEIIKRIYDSM